MLNHILTKQKDQRMMKAMVLLLISVSREISFRVDGCPSRNSRAATPHRSLASLQDNPFFVKSILSWKYGVWVLGDALPVYLSVGRRFMLTKPFVACLDSGSFFNSPYSLFVVVEVGVELAVFAVAVAGGWVGVLVAGWGRPILAQAADEPAGGAGEAFGEGVLVVLEVALDLFIRVVVEQLGDDGGVDAGGEEFFMDVGYGKFCAIYGKFFLISIKRIK